MLETLRMGLVLPKEAPGSGGVYPSVFLPSPGLALAQASWSHSGANKHKQGHKLALTLTTAQPSFYALR